MKNNSNFVSHVKLFLQFNNFSDHPSHLRVLLGALDYQNLDSNAKEYTVSKIFNHSGKPVYLDCIGINLNYLFRHQAIILCCFSH